MGFDSADSLAELAPASPARETFGEAMLALSDEPFEQSEKGEESKWWARPDSNREPRDYEGEIGN